MKEQYFNRFFIQALILILSVNLFLTTKVIAQQTEPEFPVGVFMGARNTANRTNPVLYNMFNNSGMNIMVQHSDATTADKIKNKNFNIIADNLDNAQQWIPYYSTGYYSKWESEDNQPDINKIGVKHKKINNQFVGKDTTWLGIQCWSSIGLTNPTESLVYGPHYSQDKRYKRSYNGGWLQQTIEYTARFGMALQRNQTVNPNEDVCKIKVVHRYIEMPSENQSEWIWHNDILLQRTLKVSDFNQDSSFKDYVVEDLNSIPPKTTYSYDDRFTQNRLIDNILPQVSEYPRYYDLKENTGIQFCVDWLRSDNKCTLYIDYAEVYDNDGWDKYVSPLTHNTVISQIYSYTQNYSDWSNLKYWYGQDEPSTIDAIIPMKTVASIIDNAGGPALITAQNIPAPPYWSPTNGEYFYRRYIEQVNPEIVMMDYYPFYYNRTTDESLEFLRSQLQELNTIRPGFWYIGQGFGQANVNYNRRPTPEELKATVMLSLAHGSKGIMFWKFDPEQYYTCILNDSFGTTELYDIIKNNFVPRLRGVLGNTLLNLNYTGDYISYKYFIPSRTDFPQPPSFDYLTIGLQSTVEDLNWHVGYLEDSLDLHNKYFLMTNLLTGATRTIKVNVMAPVQGYSNWRFRNIEPENSFDITFQGQTIQTLTFPEGEGYLFQVAPVVKFGGLLAFNDTIKTNTTLSDNMTIDAGKVLQINEGKTYTITDTITFTDTSSFITGYGYVNCNQNGCIITRSWNKSLFKGRSGSHPKLIWSKHPDITNIIEYKIYRDYASGGWQYLASKSNSIFEFIDSSVTIIEGLPNANEVWAQYRVTATYRPNKPVIETSPSNTIMYQRVEGQGFEKQNSVLTPGNDFTYNMDQNYPNPFNPTTTINYSIAEDGLVEIEILNILGERIITLVNEFKTKGNHNISFNASSVASGVYVYKLQAGDFVSSKKMILLK